MTKKPTTNLAHSVRQRLLNEAKRTGRLYNELEQADSHPKCNTAGKLKDIPVRSP